MRRHHFYLAGALLALVLATLLAFTPWNGTTQAQAASGEVDFSLTDLQGDPLALSDYRGKVVLLNFWATWCPPCRDEIPHFVEMVNELGDEGLVVIGLSVDRGEGIVHKWLKANPVNYPMAMSPNDLTAKWQLLIEPGMRGGIPFSFVIDKEGEVRHSIVGYRDKAQWEAMIKPLL